jgi:hypothetical protein
MEYRALVLLAVALVLGAPFVTLPSSNGHGAVMVQPPKVVLCRRAEIAG